MSLQDWCQALEVTSRDKKNKDLEAEVSQAVQLLRQQKGASFGDQPALLAWLAAEPLEVLQKTLRTLPRYRKAAGEPFMSLQDWCQALEVTSYHKKKEELEKTVWEALLRHYLQTHQQRRAKELNSLKASSVKQREELLLMA